MKNFCLSCEKSPKLTSIYHFLNRIALVFYLQCSLFYFSKTYFHTLTLSFLREYVCVSAFFLFSKRNNQSQISVGLLRINTTLINVNLIIIGGVRKLNLAIGHIREYRAFANSDVS